jgi:hypothetical protein
MGCQGWPLKVFTKPGAKGRNPALGRIMMIGGMLLLMGWVMLMGQTLWAASEEGLEVEAPYRGVVLNKTKYSLAIPSDNSDAALIIPPGGWIEYTAWQRDFNLTAYVDGKPFDCQKIFAKPRSFQYMCTSYDFVVKILPKRVPVCPPLKNQPKRRKFKAVG